MARINPHVLAAEDSTDDEELYIDHSKPSASFSSPNTSSDKENAPTKSKMREISSGPSNRQRRGVLSSASTSTTPASSRRSQKRTSSIADLGSDSENEAQNTRRRKRISIATDIQSEVEDEQEENQEEDENNVEHANREATKEATALFDEYDPDQPIEERRKVQKKYRDLHRKIQDNKNEYLKADNPEALLEVFEQVNANFKEIKQTTDACLDAKVLLTVGELAVKRAKNFASGGNSQKIEVDDFITKTIAFLETSPQANQFQGGYDWAHLGRHIIPRCTARPATKDFLLGPLSVVKRQRIMKERKKIVRRRPEETIRPIDLDKNEIAKSENSTTKYVVVISEALKTYQGAHDLENGINYFKFVVNPFSFAQTVENIFYTSFLVRDALAALTEGEDGMLYIQATEPVTRDEAIAEGVVKRQIVMDMDKKTWKEAIEVFKINECIIPMRQKEVQSIGNSGWYS